MGKGAEAQTVQKSCSENRSGGEHVWGPEGSQRTSALEKYVSEDQCELTAAQVCLFQTASASYSFLIPSMFLSIKTRRLCPACRPGTALNKHLEPCEDYLESTKCPKWDEVDKKRINL